MDLKMTELENLNHYNSFDYKSYENQSENYWEKSDNPQKKKKVSFNDILSNMNLVVNKEGVLQFMTVNHQDNNIYNTNTINKLNTTNNTKTINKINDTNVKPLDPTVKHSYIYNKYFKDYNDQSNSAPAIRVPKTIEEYRQMLLEDRIKAIQHKKMIEQVKSKKMLFTSAPGATSDPRNIQSSANNLRNMKFN